MKKIILAATLCGTVLSGNSASAALFVSGDTNIFNNVGSNAGNQAFFSNIVEGSNVVVQEGRPGFTAVVSNVVDYYDGNGFTVSLVGTNNILTMSDLVNVDLFVAGSRSNAYTIDEINILSNFLGSGGNILLTGENNADPVFIDLNANVNALLTSLGSGMRIESAFLDGPGFFAANQLGPNPYLAGTSGFDYAAASQVTGGMELFATSVSNTTFLAFEEEMMSSVPEPASWAFMIFGFGAIGGVLRSNRRRHCKLNIKVSYA